MPTPAQVNWSRIRSMTTEDLPRQLFYKALYGPKPAVYYGPDVDPVQVAEHFPGYLPSYEPTMPAGQVCAVEPSSRTP